jgi:hypothetical protein
VVNLRLGFAPSEAWEAFVWVKNVFEPDYFTYLQAQPEIRGLWSVSSAIRAPSESRPA